MLQRWLRVAATRIGIHLRFTGVICVEGTQSVSIETDWRAQIVTTRRLVFLEPPTAGDLRDTYALAVGESPNSVIYTSPDARELGREQTGPGRLTITWLPREPIRPYTVYQHQNGWMLSAMFNGSAVWLEYECDMRTGTFSIDLAAPAPFEAAVIFRRPRWPKQLSERRLVRAALHALKAPGERPQLTDDGRHIEATIGPRVGERYVFVAFRRAGIATCETWLKQTSLLGRAHRFVAGWVHAFQRLTRAELRSRRAASRRGA